MSPKSIGIVIRFLLTLVLIVYSSFETGIATAFCLFLIFIFIEVQVKRNDDMVKTIRALAQKTTNKVE